MWLSPNFIIEASMYFSILAMLNNSSSMSDVGQTRKSSKVGETSAFGGKAEVDFGLLKVCF